jgi:hypothetical protein
VGAPLETTTPAAKVRMVKRVAFEIEDEGSFEDA